ncbi:MAG: hypothetical protein KJ556_20035 [Gammaproteobacteria bacterium]|nr:hypothetical protein [Gammaproteobacteria bacterium]
MKKQRKRLSFPTEKKRGKLNLSDDNPIILPPVIMPNKKRKRLLLGPDKIENRRIGVSKDREDLDLFDPMEDVYRNVFIFCIRKERGKEYKKRVCALVCYHKEKGHCSIPQAIPYLEECRRCTSDWWGQADQVINPWKYAKERQVLFKRSKKKKKHKRKRKKLVL